MILKDAEENLILFIEPSRVGKCAPLKKTSMGLANRAKLNRGPGENGNVGTPYEKFVNFKIR